MSVSNNDKHIEYALELGEKIFRQLLPTLPSELLHLDLTMPQLKVVLLIFLTGPARMGKIASSLDVTLATATGVVDRLVERDIVLRESKAGDRRVVMCRLSDNGQQMVSSLWQSSRSRTRQLLEATDSTKLTHLIDVLEALQRAAADIGSDTRTKHGRFTKGTSDMQAKTI
jgi:DNA-binding MarR family transcriptional regulator